MLRGRQVVVGRRVVQSWVQGCGGKRHYIYTRGWPLILDREVEQARASQTSQQVAGSDVNVFSAHNA